MQYMEIARRATNYWSCVMGVYSCWSRDISNRTRGQWSHDERNNKWASPPPPPPSAPLLPPPPPSSPKMSPLRSAVLNARLRVDLLGHIPSGSHCHQRVLVSTCIKTIVTNQPHSSGTMGVPKRWRGDCYVRSNT